MSEDAAESVDPEGESVEIDVESTDGESSSDLAARVAPHDEELASEVRDLEDRVAELETELAERDEQIEDLESRLKRTQADFQNYKKRQEKRKEQLKERATEDLVERLLPVRDNLQRALDQDQDTDIRDGVESTLTELDRVLDDEDVTAIEPDPGSEVDPQRHEVMTRVASEQPEDTIADVFQPGYEMGGKVIRAARVTVSDGSGE